MTHYLLLQKKYINISSYYLIKNVKTFRNSISLDLNFNLIHATCNIWIGGKLNRRPLKRGLPNQSLWPSPCMAVSMDQQAWCFQVLNLHGSSPMTSTWVRLSGPALQLVWYVSVGEVGIYFASGNHKGFAPTSQKPNRYGSCVWRTHKLSQSYNRLHLLCQDISKCLPRSLPAWHRRDDSLIFLWQQSH